MGRNKRRHANKKPKLDTGNGHSQKGVRQNYDEIIKENAEFEKYYKMQKICTEEEWPAFMETLQSNLPTAFRITATRSQAKALLHILQENLLRDAIMSGQSSDESAIKPFQLPWYPENLAWQINLSRNDIRRNESYFRLHRFLLSETTCGNISRQEAVSMIPPLALKVEPHHKVLDMCAAPGSKTAQIIEILQDRDEKEPEGLVIANDMDNKRCYMLVHQAKRLHSPAFIITNHDAAKFPDLFYATEDGKKERLEFDRVLCDVPCSADGTMRKNIDIWKKWSVASGTYLHQIQHQILKRGLELLKVGGYLVYSTCSLNPIENEGVIHRILKEAQGTVELADIDIPNLKYAKGLSHWKPCSKDLVGYNSVEEVPDKWKTTIRDYIFPPSPEDAPKYALHKCVRVLAHHQDTGNFFIALLKKTGELPWKPASFPSNDGDSTEQSNANDSQTSNQTTTSSVRTAKKNKMRGYREDPYVFMTEDDPIWLPLKDFYSLDDRLKSTNLLTRSEGKKKRNIYFVTDLVKNIVLNNTGKVKIINTGVKVLARCGQKWSATDFRLAQEGLMAILPYIHGRIATISKDDLIMLLENDDHTDKPPVIETLSKPSYVQVLPYKKGSCVLHIESEIENGGPKFILDLVGWRGIASLRAYVPACDKIHYLRLLGGDISKYETNKFQEIRDAAEAASTEMEQTEETELVEEEEGEQEEATVNLESNMTEVQ